MLMVAESLLHSHSPENSDFFLNCVELSEMLGV